ncbi:MAG TPA: prepilin peptidase [Streptosporangiaceae bacterium]|nr:prepilin peptidase [Streptosporangiaceae bacterium]
MIWTALATSAVTAVASAGAGLLAGLSLRGEIVRLSVRGGEPEQGSCGDCAAPLPGQPAWRCEHCAGWIGAPIALEFTTAAITALLLAKFGAQPAVAAFVYLAIIGVALTQIDVAVQRLPDRLTLPAYPALIVLLTVAAATGSDWAALLRAVLGALAIGAGYLVLALASGGQVGGGDVKVAGLIGLLLGWLSWRALITGACAGFVLAAAATVALLAARSMTARSMTGRRMTMRSPISFGPFLLGGALLSTLATAIGPR